MRCLDEAQMHKGENSFITLTYDDEHLPPDGSLERQAFPLFMKRLRKKVKKNFGSITAVSMVRGFFDLTIMGLFLVILLTTVGFCELPVLVLRYIVLLNLSLVGLSAIVLLAM